MTRPNGITTNYGYDAVSNLLSVLHQQGATTLDGASYTYDSAGNPKSKTNLLNNAVSNFSYDNAYQLTGVTGPNPESYTYDPVGNRLTSQSVSNYAYNNSNELTTAGSATYTYDDNGNTLNKTDSTGTAIYTWDFENRLTTVQLPNSTTVSFKYDPFGRRVNKSGTSTTNYVYDGAKVIAEVDQSGNLLARYSQGAAIDEPLSAFRSGASSYYEQDGLGSVTSLTTSTASLANNYVYDTFGNLTASTGSLTNPFQYTGRDYDSETGLRYYRARYFDGTIGRFVSEDPIHFDGGLNFYWYADNDPVDFADPSGLQSQQQQQPSNGNALPIPVPPVPHPDPIPFPEPKPGPAFCTRFPFICALALPFIPMNGGEDPQRVRCATELFAPGCAFGKPVSDPTSTNANCASKNKWRCRVRCALINIRTGSAEGYIEADGFGQSERDAFQAGQNFLQNSTPPGFRTKHCHVVGNCQKQ